MMLNLLINWLLSAVSLMIVAHVIRGFEVSGFVAALIAALVIGLVNATLGAFLKLITFPLTLLTLGLFWFVINALMLKLVAVFVPGFTIEGFIPAFFGAVVLSLVNLFLRLLSKAIRNKPRGASLV
jgi:putative membrane protein